MTKAASTCHHNPRVSPVQDSRNAPRVSGPWMPWRSEGADPRWRALYGTARALIVGSSWHLTWPFWSQPLSPGLLRAAVRRQSCAIGSSHAARPFLPANPPHARSRSP
eukprot:1864125-Rhodomonas_salina.1